jgi:hypothetical protein
LDPAGDLAGDRVVVCHLVEARLEADGSYEQNVAVLVLHTGLAAGRLARKLAGRAAFIRDWDIEKAQAQHGAWICGFGVPPGELFLRVAYRADTIYPERVLGELRKITSEVVWQRWVVDCSGELWPCAIS